MALDLTEHAADAARRRLAPSPPPAPAALAPLPARRGARIVVVAGPGVLAAGARAGLAALAAITGATVVNTVGAKGVFRWDDPVHGGTVGVQVGDTDLSEITTADLVVTTGLVAGESEGLHAALVARRSAEPDAVVDVAPSHLALAAGGWPPADRPGPRPPLYDRIAAVVGPMYAAEPDSSGAVPPARAAGDLASTLPTGGLVVAPPGPAGFWLGRTFPTSEAGSVVVTPGEPEGTAAALAVEAARLGRPTVLVLGEPGSAPALAAPVAEVGRAEALALTVQVWTDDAAAAPDPPLHPVVVDWGAIDPLVAVAGRPDPALWPGAPVEPSG